MKLSLLQLEAQSLGFPPSLFGFGPELAAYWWEPGLPHVANPAAAAALASIAADTPEFLFSTNQMGPRFPLGTSVLLSPAPACHPLQLGRVYVYLPAEHGEPEVGRLAWLHDTELELTQDNSPQVLRWPVDKGQVYAVTHYVDCTGPRAFPGPRAMAVAPPYQLELHANQMGPRYSAGARYLIYLVPPTRWAQARGVHALELHNGQQVLARLIGPTRDALACTFDGTGGVGTLPLAAIAYLWRLGACHYMPEETEAEHQAIVDRPIG